MAIKLKEIAAFAMDEALAAEVMDADGIPSDSASMPDNRPPDLVAHDNQYHHGHYDGGECKYRKQREAFLSRCRTDQQKTDAIDKFGKLWANGETPDPIDEVDKAVAQSVTEVKPTEPASETKPETDSDTQEYSSPLATSSLSDWERSPDGLVDIGNQIALGHDYSGPMSGMTTLGEHLKTASQEDKNRIALTIARMLGASWALDLSSKTSASPEDQHKVEAIDAATGKMKNALAIGFLNRIRDGIQKKIDASKGDGKMDAVRAFAETIGLDPNRVGEAVGATDGDAPSAGLTDEKMAQLEKEKADILDEIDAQREMINLMSPELAANITGMISALEQRVSDIDDCLGGRSGGSKRSEHGRQAAQRAAAERKAKKEAEKAAKKAAIKDMQANMSDGATTTTDEATPVGKTSVLTSEDFKKKISEEPAENKIYALSDIHDAPYKKMGMSKFGTVVMAGDFTHDGATSHSGQISMDEAVKSGNAWLQDSFAPFCAKHPDQKFVLIAGNHDHFLGDESADSIQWPSNVSYLKDSETTVNGMRVYGTPWCEKRKGAAKTASMDSQWARQPFEIDDADIKEKFDKIPEGLDILVCHQPPLCDDVDANGNAVGPDVAFVGGQMKHCGSAALTEAIKRAKPKLVICGHLHDSDHRPYKIGDSVVMNTAHVSGRSKPSFTKHEIGVVRDNFRPPEGETGIGFYVDGEDKHIIA